ncbi:hypothetical protein QBC46DRAFT_433919 [Diplogelasinospora grovesii]|uniref:Cytochrome P450 n=1 Tax=Diplogelasinospora grovesii TaxID=303347 RepID=A0AAN6NBQ3_9PEZI|nr:hypothetical protein QBC46DRAFT_433919 [Diplogelasinospora grovesii]
MQRWIAEDTIKAKTTIYQGPDKAPDAFLTLKLAVGFLAGIQKWVTPITSPYLAVRAVQPGQATTLPSCLARSPVLTFDSPASPHSLTRHNYLRPFRRLQTLPCLLRLWRFTLVPALYPDSPKSLPYLIPYFGHLFGMSRNPGKVFTTGRKYFKNTREPFSLIVLGQEYYIVTSPSDIMAVFKDPTKLDYDLVARRVSTPPGTGFDRSTHNLASSSPKMCANIEPKVPAKSLLSSTHVSKTVSLWKWCAYSLMESATWAFFGDAIFEIAAPEELFAIMYKYDMDAWKVHARYPPVGCQGGEKREDAAWSIKTLDEGMIEAGVTEPGQRACSRKPTAPVAIGGKALEPGRTLLMPLQAEPFFNPDVLGPDADRFDPWRFVSNKESAADHQL